MDDEQHDVEIDIIVVADNAWLRCGDESFGRLFEALKSQPGVIADLGHPTAIHIEKTSVYKAGPTDPTWGNRIGLLGCGLVALVVIFGLVNGAVALASLLHSF